MKQESRIGLYLTIIVHLVALIVVLSLQVSSMIQKESSFILDFTPQEELELEQQREEIRARVSEGLDDLIAGIQRESRNVAVDASLRNRPLKDDRHPDPSQVYKEAEALQERLDASRKEIDKLLMDKLSDVLSERQKKTKVGSLLTKMRRAGVICNNGSRKEPSWELI